MEELDSKLTAADAALKKREDEFAKTLAEKDAADVKVGGSLGVSVVGSLAAGRGGKRHEHTRKHANTDRTQSLIYPSGESFADGSPD